jgi:antitoxin ParD1/3/4
MAKNTSISLGAHFDAFISEAISQGRYATVSEVIRAALRLLEDDERRLQALRTAIEEGLESGIHRDFHPEEYLISLKARKRGE